MNKIKIVNNNFEMCKNSSKIEFICSPKNDWFDIININIKVHKDISIAFIYTDDYEVKAKITIDIDDNVVFNLFEKRTGTGSKIQYKYNLNENSTLNINKFYDVNTFKESVIINLNGKDAKCNYNFKTISTNTEKYDILIYHNNKNTVSNINNGSVNIKNGSVIVNVSAFIPKNSTNTISTQNNRIINLTNNKCQINPNLFIDEEDSKASHSALIGGFNSLEMFYLQSRGINEKEAEKLLVKGFLTGSIPEECIKGIDKIINTYWR